MPEAPGPAPGPSPRPLLACGQRGPPGGGGAVGSRLWALCGPRSPPRGTICSLSMHHLLVWAVARATEGGGGGEIKERVRLGVGTGCRGGGWAQFCLLHPGTGQAGWRGWGVVTTTRSDRALLLAAPQPLLRATPTRGGWNL